ncbi:hypothetical protein SAMN05414139_00902 [Burkholderia sp. D7]|nr:hypothetical protein SAMN05414139_00902 [Burkholderia sp. D7]
MLKANKECIEGSMKVEEETKHTTWAGNASLAE